MRIFPKNRIFISAFALVCAFGGMSACGKGAGGTAGGGASAGRSSDGKLLFSQIETNQAFKDDFLLENPECSVMTPRWGFVPKKAVFVDDKVVSLRDLFSHQRKTLILRSVAVEVALRAEKNAGGITLPRVYRVFQGLPSTMTAKFIRENPGSTTADAELGRDKKAAFTFTELCASKDDVTFKNQDLRTSYPTEIIDGGQFSEKAQLDEIFSTAKSVPSTFALETSGVESLVPDLKLGETAWLDQRAYYTDSTLILQYTKKATEILEISSAPTSPVVEGDTKAAAGQESQLTLTLMYQTNEADPNPEAWTSFVR